MKGKGEEGREGEEGRGRGDYSPGGVMDHIYEVDDHQLRSIDGL